MKKLLLIHAFIITANLLFAQIPISYYLLNGNAKDAMGYRNGKIHGAVTSATDRFGNVNGAMYFPGNTESYIEIANDGAFEESNISISLWVNIASQNALSTFVDKAISCINDSWHLGTENNNFSAWVSNSRNCGDFVQLTSPLTTGIWKHVVFTIDATAKTRKLYIDGVLVASGTYTSSVPYNRYPVLFGAAIENDIISFPLNGTLDNIRIYYLVLTQSQVTDIFNNVETCNRIDDNENGLVDEVCIPVFNVNDLYTDEGDTDTSLIKFAVNLSNVYQDTVSVKYITIDKNATANIDYIPVKGQLVFAPGETSKYIKVPIIGDTVKEREERFQLHFYQPVNGTILYQAKGFIEDDDAAVIVATTTEALKFNNIKIAPNPAKDFITITGLTQNNRVQIINANGVVVLQQTIDNNAQINISKLPAGVYLLRYKENDIYKTIRFVKD